MVSSKTLTLSYIKVSMAEKKKAMNGADFGDSSFVIPAG